MEQYEYSIKQWTRNYIHDFTFNAQNSAGFAQLCLASLICFHLRLCSPLHFALVSSLLCSGICSVNSLVARVFNNSIRRMTWFLTNVGHNTNFQIQNNMYSLFLSE